jgi:hypothetical protein
VEDCDEDLDEAEKELLHIDSSEDPETPSLVDPDKEDQEISSKTQRARPRPKAKPQAPSVTQALGSGASSASVEGQLKKLQLSSDDRFLSELTSRSREKAQGMSIFANMDVSS